MNISVVICTHNPRPHYLRRVLDALKAQTLPKYQWELLLIDNASQEPLAQAWDLSWHPLARHVREGEIGLTPARLRGIRESTGEVLVFVDDDNVLAEDYLAQAGAILRDWPMLGVIGGSCKGEFEISPPDSIVPYLDGLAIGELDRNCWSNCEGWSEITTPPGAGLSVRRRVAEDYAKKVTGSRLRRMLDRAGAGLGAGGDIDLALCAIDLGMGTGRFASLKLIHLIPKVRLTEDYIIRLYAGFAAAREILSFIRSNRQTKESCSWKKPVRFFIEFVKAKGIQRKIFLASEKARNEARRLIATHGMAP